MKEGRPVIKWVSDSAVRSELLHTVSRDSCPTSEVLETVDASESAVYAAVNDLERRGLLVEHDAGWVATGRGQLVADLLGQRDAVEDLLAHDVEYWQEHDLSVLPRQFRLRLGALTEYEVIRVTQTDPRRVIREVSNYIREADDVQILAPIYTDEYATAMPDTEATKLLLSTDVVEGALAETVKNPQAEEPEHAQIRIGEAPVGFTLTPDALLLSFPTLEGQYGTQDQLLMESEAALQWGQELFDYYWEQAMEPPGY